MLGNSKQAKELDGVCRPSERDMMEVPQRPDLRCIEHGSVCGTVNLLCDLVWRLEQRVRKLEEGYNV